LRFPVPVKWVCWKAEWFGKFVPFGAGRDRFRRDGRDAVRAMAQGGSMPAVVLLAGAFDGEHGAPPGKCNT
jgi:hypothetical protein